MSFLYKAVSYPFRKLYFWSVYSYRHLRALPLFVYPINHRWYKLYKKNQTALTAVQKRIVLDLKKDGIAVTSLEELSLKNISLQDLQKYAQHEIEKATIGKKKPFLNYIWGQEKVEVDMSSVFFQFSLDPTIIQITNAYLGIYSKFVFSSLNITNPMENQADAKGSQRWHRDPSSGDKKICKIFIYLNDVDDETGPFEYVRSTHRSGDLGKLFPSFYYDGYYPSGESAIKEKVPKENFFSATGKAGTIIFCDTTGFHRGGYSRKKSRIMSTSFYVTPGSLQKAQFTYAKNFKEEIQSLPKESYLAIKP